ncbi:hypothetical protein PoB_004059300 [Plakobranchus ocellatus]|uniref:Uncharacterized protein n=1 Tax=Plakobranchus ocellatus TaxID=259542 RepID=A0AAV4B4T1_9GAST|nr:hypothetical protein PoB_004059300 [Plakobranchus ocellatus]
MVMMMISVTTGDDDDDDDDDKEEEVGNDDDDDDDDNDDDNDAAAAVLLLLLLMESDRETGWLAENIASPQQGDLSFQALRQARALMTGLEPATECSCRFQGGFSIHCATDAP